MRAVIQRVSKASVSINNQVKSEIKTGLILLIGIEESDTNEDIVWLSNKITQLRIFDDKDGVVSTFPTGANVIGNTLSLNYKEGNLIFIPEIRFDSASKTIFAADNPSKTSTFALIGMTYSF